MARSPIPDLIERFHSLTPEERKCFLDLVDPQPEPEPAAKPKKRRTRTPRTGLPDAAKDAKADAPKSNGQLCKALVPGLDVECNEPEDNLIHDKNAGYAAYHPFSLTALPAEKKSKKKGAAASSTPSSETGTGAALSASGD